jgi:hypothetical protein
LNELSRVFRDNNGNNKENDSTDGIRSSSRSRILVAWNDRDLSDDFVSEWETLVERYNPKYNRDMEVAENYEYQLNEHNDDFYKARKKPTKILNF